MRCTLFSIIKYLSCRLTHSHIYRWDDFPHGTAVSFVIMSIIVVFAFNMENNDSRLMYIPKKEFVKVMSGIISGSSEANGEATDPRSRREKDGSISTATKVIIHRSQQEIELSKGTPFIFSSAHWRVEQQQRKKCLNSIMVVWTLLLVVGQPLAVVHLGLKTES